MVKFSLAMRLQLSDLARFGTVQKSCTNPTLCALQTRGMVKWDLVPSKHAPGHMVEEWSLTDLGKRFLS